MKPNVELIDEVKALREQVRILERSGAIFIIALGHSGYDRDKEIARNVEGLDLVIGGHTHTFLYNGSNPDFEEIVGPYPTYVTQPSGRNVAIVQAYAYTKYIGQLYVTFDHGNIAGMDGKAILLDKTVPEDEEVLKIVDKYKTEFGNYAEEVIGYTSILLDGSNCDRQECNLGNVITDAVVNYYATNYYKGDHWTDAPIAFIQAGYIKASISHASVPSVISKGDLLAALPFSDNLVTMQVSGSTLIKMLEHSIASVEPSHYTKSRKFLQMSGLRVTYDRNRPLGLRVVSAAAKCWFCEVPGYSPVETRQYYKIIVSSFLSQGGDGYRMLKGIPTVALPFNFLYCTEYYIAKHSPIYPGIDGRITILE